MSRANILFTVIVFFFCSFCSFGEVPKIDIPPDTKCSNCINHDIASKYKDLYACEGNWKCKWESSVLIYINCLNSNKAECQKKAIEGLTSVLQYVGPPNKSGKKYYRLAFDTMTDNFDCNELTRKFYHNAAITFGYICDEEYFLKTVEMIKKGCPTNIESQEIFDSIKLGHDYYLSKNNVTEFYESSTKRWNNALDDCGNKIFYTQLSDTKKNIKKTAIVVSKIQKDVTKIMGCGYILKNIESNEIIFWEGNKNNALININGEDINLNKIDHKNTGNDTYARHYEYKNITVTIFNTITSRGYESHGVDASIKIEIDGVIKKVSAKGGEFC